MKSSELKLLREMVTKLRLGFMAIESIEMTVKYTDGVSDTFNFGGDKAGKRTSDEPPKEGLNNV